MANWLNYHHLYYFYQIALLGSVTLAAKKLRLNQSTLSTQLKQFEGFLGSPLFERKNRKLFLTDQGALVLEYARMIFESGQEMIEVLKKGPATKNISVRIGALDGVPKKVVLKLCQKILNTEGYRISLIEGRPELIFQELKNHQLDFLITNFIPSHIDHKNVLYKTIYKSQIKIYGEKSRYSHLKKGFPKSLENESIVLPTYDSKLRFDFDSWLQQKKIKINPILESQDIHMNHLLASEGHGLVALSDLSIEPNSPLVEIGETNINEELYLVMAFRKIESTFLGSTFESFEIEPNLKKS